MKINKPQFKIISIGLFAIFIIIVASLASIKVNNQLKVLESKWLDYNRITSETETGLKHIERQLGYGGFIHRFKNFVLRQDRSLIPKIYQNLDDFDKQMIAYRHLNISDTEIQALDTLNKTVLLYRGKFELAQHLLEQNTLTAEALDKVVKIDDTSAIAALEVLLNANNLSRIKMETETTAELNNTQDWLLRGAVSIPLIAFFTLILILNMRRLTKANIEIKQAQSYLNQQLEAAPDAMLSVDKKGHIVRINNQALKLFGYEFDEIIGQKLEMLIPQRFLTQHRAYRSAYFEHPELRPMGVKGNKELVALHKKGYEFAVEINLGYLSQKGETFCVATIRNIEARKHAEEALRKSEANLKNTLSALPIAIAITDKAHEKFIYFNRMFTQEFGYTLEEVSSVEDWWQKVLSDENKRKEYHKSWLSGLQPHSNVNTEHTWEIDTKEGEKTINFKLVPLEDQGLITMLDLTAQLKTQKSLLAAKLEAEKADQAKSEFLANMSHEIRTPMNAINGMCYLALNTALTLEQQDFIKKIQSSSQSLLTIINDILDFSKIEAGQLELEKIPFNLSDVLDTIANISAVNVEHKDVEVLYDIPPNLPHDLIGDPLRLGQILINLTNNAVKFTAKGEIVIRIHIKKTLSHKKLLFAFDVEDTGIGMSEAQLKTLFNSFQQADNSITRRYGGSGLGLAISKRLVELMHGEISVESVPKIGSKFHFTAEFEMQDGSEAVINLESIDALKCLVVDDNKTAQLVFKKMLESFQFQVAVVSSAKEAFFELHRVQQHDEKPYDVVLMDYRMPDENGLEAAEKIKDDKGLKTTPTVIMVTAHDRSYLKKNMRDKHLDGLLVKPISASTMLNSILYACGHEIAIQKKEAEKHEPLRNKLHYTGIHILLVEDNPTNQQVGQGILEAAGAKIDIANNGVEAIQKISNNDHYDVVLMDLQMPEMDGFKATEFIRANYFSYKKVPIIAMTANAMKGDREKCLESGMNDHIPKPINIHVLFETLDKWLNLEVRPLTSSSDLSLSDFPTQLVGINLSEALQRLSGDHALFKRIVCNFYAEHQVLLDRLKQTLEAKNWDLARQYTHQFKGSAGNISATEIAQSAKELENLLKEQHYSSIPAALTQLSESFAELKSSVNKLEAWNENPTPEDTGIQYNELELQQQLELLEQQLYKNDFKAEKLFTVLKPSLETSESINAQDLKAIETLINTLEYEKAAKIIQDSFFPALKK